MVRRSLNGLWKFHHDAEGSLTVSAIREDFHWERAMVPQNWYRSGGPDRGGVCWYRKTFTLQSDYRGRRVFLRFDGVDYTCVVWVNGIRVGGHEGYFQPFECDITAAVRYEGINTLTVRVVSPEEQVPAAWPAAKQAIKGAFHYHDTRPGGKKPHQGQRGNTGGIWNDVTLLVTGDIRIDRVRVVPLLLDNGDAQVIIRTRLSNYSGYRRSIRLSASLDGDTFTDGPPLTGQREYALEGPVADQEMVLTVRRPRLWWTWDQGASDLYLLNLVVHGPDGIADTRTVRFGIRSVREDGDRALVLNGRRVFLRGTCCMPAEWLSDYNGAAVDRDVELIRTANLNAVRLWSHVNRTELYDACDRAGILVWQDFPLHGGYENSDGFREKAVTQVRDMIDLLGNHCSVALWCCHNEPGSQADSLDRLLALTAREADGTRPVRSHTGITDHPFAGWDQGSIDDFRDIPGAPLPGAFGAQALPDAPGLERIFKPDAAFPLDRAAWEYRGFQYDKAFRVWDAAPDDSAERLIDVSRKYQARLIKRAVEAYRCARFSPVAGFFQYLFADPWPAVSFAVLDWQRTPKPGYEALRTACQPVLAAFRVGAEGKDGISVLEDIVIVNDLPERFDAAVLRMDYAVPDSGAMQSHTREIDIPPAAVVSAGIPSGSLPDGPVHLTLRLVAAGGALLSVNSELVRIAGTVQE